MAAETLATFRICKEKWQRFQEMAKSQETYASALLKQFINSYLAGDEFCIGNNLDKNIDVEQLIDSCIESRLAHLLRELEGMQTHVQSLESSLYSRIDKLEAQPPASLPVEMEAGNDEMNAELSELRSALLLAQGSLSRNAELEKINQELRDLVSALEEEKRQSTDLMQQQNQSVPDYEAVRDLVLKKLKVGRQSSAGKAIDAFMKELDRNA